MLRSLTTSMRNFLSPRSTMARYDPNTVVAAYFEPSGRVHPITMKTMQGWSNGEFNALGASMTSRSNAPASLQGFAYLSEVNVWIRRCIEIRAQTIARLEWYVEDKLSGERVPDHPLMVAINRSRHYMLRYQRAMDIWGEVYTKPLLNRYGYYSDVWWLNNLSVSFTIVNGQIVQYYFVPLHGGTASVWGPLEVSYIWNENAFDDLHGSSRVLSILHEANVHEEIARSAQAHFANDARPGVMFITDVDMGPNFGQEFLDYWKANFQGSLNTNKPVLLPGAIKTVQVLERADLKDDVEFRGTIRREICAAFGVPLSVAGAWDDANYQSAPEQRKSLYEETIIPTADEHAKDMTMSLLPFFERTERYRVWYDAKKLLALAEDKEQKSTALITQLTSGGLTLNQYRAAMDLEEIPQGNVFYIPNTVTVTPLDKLGTMPPPAQPSGGFGFNAAPPQAPTPTPPAAEPAKASQSMAMLLSCADNPDLIGLQKRLKELFPDPSMQWTDPSAFHITLVYVPSFDETMTPNLTTYAKSYAPPEMSLSVGSLASFDNVGRHALHFRIPRNATLMDCQEELHTACESLGLQTSAYSNPANYKPHITMGYSKQRIPITRYQGNLRVSPSALEISVENEGKHTVVHRSELAVTPANPPETIQSPAQLTEEPMAAAKTTWEDVLLHSKTLPIAEYKQTMIDKASAADTAGEVIEYNPRVASPIPQTYELTSTVIDIPAWPHAITVRHATEPIESDAPIVIKDHETLLMDELSDYEKFTLNRWGKPLRAFNFNVIEDPIRADLIAWVGMQKTKSSVKGAFEVFREHLKAKDDEPDIVTPEQAQEWWGDYDRLSKTLGNDWLRDYMKEVWRRLESRLSRDISVSDVQTLLEDFHPDLIEKWTGTADEPGVIAKLFMAGMGAGQAALTRKRVNLNPAKAIELQLDWSLIPSDAIKEVERYVKRLIGTLDKTTLKDFEKALIVWLESGGTLEELKRQLTPIFNDPDRAELIATTEASHAYNRGAVQRWTDAGVQKMRLVTVNDSHVCPQCSGLAGHVAPIDEGWYDDTTGSYVFIPIHQLCRCFARPVLE